VAGKNLFEGLGMRFDPGHDAAERTESEVHQPFGGTTDDHQVAVEHRAGDRPGKNLPGRKVAAGHLGRVMHPEFALCRGRNPELADPDLFHTDVAALRFQHIVLLTLGYPQRFRDQCRNGLACQLQHQRHSPDHAVTIRDESQCAIALGDLCQLGQCRNRPVKAMQPAFRLLP
jgi:hypothetical protein